MTDLFGKVMVGLVFVAGVVGTSAASGAIIGAVSAGIVLIGPLPVGIIGGVAGGLLMGPYVGVGLIYAMGGRW